MSNLDSSTNPQIERTDVVAGETEQKKIDNVADSMAGKAGRVQSKNESTINSGAVTPGGGGIFSK